MLTFSLHIKLLTFYDFFWCKLSLLCLCYKQIFCSISMHEGTDDFSLLANMRGIVRSPTKCQEGSIVGSKNNKKKTLALRKQRSASNFRSPDEIIRNIILFVHYLVRTRKFLRQELSADLPQLLLIFLQNFLKVCTIYLIDASTRLIYILQI